jgi:endo-1,3-1,4-beta-glycanase ExoK
MKTKIILLLSFSFLFCSVNLYSKDYKGAEIYSNETVLYGRFEMSMKACNGSGILSTFFLYKNGSEQANTFWEEIDIEIFGKDNAQTFQSNIITDGLSGGTIGSEEEHHYSFSLSDTFHVFALEWTPYYVAWFFDDVEVRRDSSEQVATLTNPQSYRFNTWISESAGWAGSYNPNVLPQKQYVDWLKYYSYNEGSANIFQLEWTDNFDTFNSQRWSKANWTFDGNLVDFSPNNVSVEDGLLVLSLTDETPPTQTEKVLNSDVKYIYPNPADNELFIDQQENTEFEYLYIYNSAGVLTIQKALNSGKQRIDISSLIEGIYIIKMSGKNKEVTDRFIKWQ